MIPFYSDPYDGELLYSWIFRLAKLNHLPLKSFGHSYLGIKSVNKDTLPLDARLVFKVLCEHIPAPADIAKLFLDTSVFRMCAMTMTPEVQARYLNNVWFPRDALNHTVPGLFNEVRYCPECMKEDEAAYGSYYMHAVHHLPGVKCCPKHGCALIYHKGTTKRDPEEFNAYEDVTDSDAAYAKYAEALYNAKIDTDIFAVKDVITERYEELGYMVANGYEPLIKDLDTWKHGVLWGVRGSDLFLKTKLVKARNVTVTELIPLLMFLFPDPEDFIAALPEHEPLTQAYTCFTCGKTYLASPTAVRQGWGCPECVKDIPVADRFKTLVNTAGNGEYELASEFNSMTERIDITHTPCGKTFSITPEYFIFRHGRCPCTISDFDPYTRVAAHPGFQLISYNGAHSVCTIFHRDCSQEFKCDFYKFLEAPKCRACTPTRYTQETYVKAVQDLVGDEYTVVGEYKGRKAAIDIKHNVCHATTPFEAGAFLKGRRCPKCAEKHIFIDLAEELDAYSKGRYALVRAENGWEALDTYTGESIPLSLNELLQEMRRPTPSPVLPLDGTEGDGWVPYWYRMYMLLTAYRNIAGTVKMKRGLWFDGQPLGRWIAAQTDLLTDGLLSDEKASLLSDAGVVSTKRLKSRGLSRDENWDRRAEQLKRYVEINGPGFIPHSVIFENERPGVWTDSQRKKFERGELSEEKVRILNEIDPHCLLPCPYNRDRAREEWLSLLKDFIDEYDESAISSKTVYHKKDLGRWVYGQRLRFKSGTIDPEMAEILVSLLPDLFHCDSTTTARLDAEWDHHCDQYEQCLKEYGTVRFDAVYDGFSAGTWFCTQRRRYLAGTLKETRAERLLSINKEALTAMSASEAWDTNCRNYEDFVKENGPVPIPKDYTVSDTGINLNNWIALQIKRHRAGTLEPYRAERLVSINENVFDPVSPTEELWRTMLEQYKEYVKETGSYYLVGSATYHGYALGKWYQTQRAYHRQNKISKKRLEALLAACPDVFGPKPDVFYEQFEEYLRYVEETGLYSVPVKATYHSWNIGNWFQGQVIAYRKGTMPKEHAELFLNISSDLFSYHARHTANIPKHEPSCIEDCQNESIDRYERYVRLSGDPVICPGTMFEKKDLYSWYVEERRKYRENRLSESQIARLLSINPSMFDGCEKRK